MKKPIPSKHVGPQAHKGGKVPPPFHAMARKEAAGHPLASMNMPAPVTGQPTTPGAGMPPEAMNDDGGEC